jgi:hypothetical protein
VNSILIAIFNGEPGMVRHESTDEQKKILERMHNRVDYIFQAYKEYFDALAEYDKTGVLRIRGKVLIERREK